MTRRILAAALAALTLGDAAGTARAGIVPEGVLYFSDGGTIYRLHHPLGEAVHGVTPPGYPAPYDVGDAVLRLLEDAGLIS